MTPSQQGLPTEPEHQSDSERRRVLELNPSLGVGTWDRGFQSQRRHSYLFLLGGLHPGTVIRHRHRSPRLGAGTPPPLPTGFRSRTVPRLLPTRGWLALAPGQLWSPLGWVLAGASVTVSSFSSFPASPRALSPMALSPDFRATPGTLPQRGLVRPGAAGAGPSQGAGRRALSSQAVLSCAAARPPGRLSRKALVPSVLGAAFE